MSALDKVAAVLAPVVAPVKKGFMPDKPDVLTALFEYDGPAPEHYFAGHDTVHAVQVRIRAPTDTEAWQTAERISKHLNRYHDGEISVIQSTSILPIGMDNANPPRAEYTINFRVRRY